MIAPFNITQRYFEFFQQKVNELYPSQSLSVDNTATWWMKTLYFACLNSVRVEDDNVIDNGLFDVFKNWEAYPNGPVATEPYQTFQEMATLDGVYHSDNIQTTPENNQKIENAILDLLKYSKYRAIAGDKIQLIKLAHDLYLWEVAYEMENKKLFVDDDLSIRIEKEMFLKEIL